MRICTTFFSWVVSSIVTPIQTFVTNFMNVCNSWPWPLSWICGLVAVVVAIIVYIVVLICVLVAFVVCVIEFIIHILGFILNLIYLIPIIGPIIRNIFNFILELIWRIIGIFGFIADLAGSRARKQMQIKLVIPKTNGVPLDDQASIEAMITQITTFFNTTCNIQINYLGTCIPDLEIPQAANRISCGVDGVLEDFTVAGWYYHAITTFCDARGWSKNLIGYGPTLFVIIIGTVDPGNTNGCSNGPVTEYVLIEARDRTTFLIAHEMGHTCGLPHDGGATNLMNGNVPAAVPTLTNFQIAWIRNSRFVTYV